MTFPCAQVPIQPIITFLEGTALDQGVGEESDQIKDSIQDVCDHVFSAFTYMMAHPETKFEMLKSKWESETLVLSSESEIAMHPAYQQIIGMGDDAIFSILKDLQLGTTHWFWALKSITGEDPVLPSDRGDMEKMRKTWLKWGAENNYL